MPLSLEAHQLKMDKLSCISGTFSTWRDFHLVSESLKEIDAALMKRCNLPNTEHPLVVLCAIYDVTRALSPWHLRFARLAVINSQMLDVTTRTKHHHWHRSRRNWKWKKKKKLFFQVFCRKSHPVKVLQHLSLSPCPCIPLKWQLKTVKVIHLCAQSFSPNVIFHWIWQKIRDWVHEAIYPRLLHK